jgi:hypothetical protein
MTSKKTNPAPDGLPVAGFANLDYDEFDAAVIQGLLPFVHSPNQEQTDAEAYPLTDTF